MEKLKKFNQLFEADIRSNKGLPSDYIRDIENKARQEFGYRPTHADMMEMGRLVNEVFRYQRGHEDKLTEIGKNIIINFYGAILDNVELDIKIVQPNDKEKAEMVNKMLNKNEEENEDSDNKDETIVQEEEIDKRKIINNVMQGEAQNVHSMIYTAKDEIDEINPRLIDIYMRLLELNRKFDWCDEMDLKNSMEEHPEFANAVEVDWKDNKEKPDNFDKFKKMMKGEDLSDSDLQDALTVEGKPVIKVRALDICMLIHESVKGIYELIASSGLPSDPVKAKQLLKQTENIEDEKIDIQFGSYIAADLRDYMNELIYKNEDARDIQNIREFIFGKMVELPANKFIELFKGIIMKTEEAEAMMNNLLYDVILDFKNFDDEDLEEKPIFLDDDEKIEYDDEDLEETPKKLKKEQEVDYSIMSQSQLNKELDIAIDNNDIETIKKIEKYLK
jgi:hypothetical protein